MDITYTPDFYSDRIILRLNDRYKNKLFVKRLYLIFLDRIINNCKNPFDISEVSSLLCVSERTLYRRLEKNDSSYLKVKDDFRKEYAIYLLRLGKYNIYTISTILNFNSSSAFIQSFKRWYGCTPREWISINY